MNIGLLGYGTVGRGVYKQCLENGINVKYILVRDKNKKLDVDSILCEDINEIVNDKEIDTVVECIGGNNPAFDYASLVLKNKKNFVSANKKMLVTYLKEINDLALENNVSLLYSQCTYSPFSFLHKKAGIFVRAEYGIVKQKGILPKVTVIAVTTFWYFPYSPAADMNSSIIII